MPLAFDYTLQRKRGMKSVRLSISKNGNVLVSAPYFVSKKHIEQFLAEKTAWVQEKSELMKKRFEESPRYGSYATHAKRAKKLLKERVEAINIHYKYSYNRISIKQHETRWGSCSKKGNLNFNYRLFFLPLFLIDYVVAHELCHLKEMNHSKNFWNLVAQTIPDYRQRKLALKNYT